MSKFYRTKSGLIGRYLGDSEKEGWVEVITLTGNRIRWRLDLIKEYPEKLAVAWYNAVAEARRERILGEEI